MFVDIALADRNKSEVDINVTKRRRVLRNALLVGISLDGFQGRLGMVC
jgi:hypothetical protein